MDQAHQFLSPPSGDAAMDFVNQLGYTEVIHFVPRMEAIQTFLTDKANLGSPTKKGRKDKPHVISFCRFTKLIIYHLGRVHNIHQRSTSPFHLAEEDLRLAEKEGKMKTVSAKQPKSKPAIEKSCKPAPGPKPKATKERPSKASTAKPPKPKPSKENPFQLVNEPDEEPALSKPEPELEHQGEGDEDDMKCAIQMKATQPLLVVEGKGKTIVTKEQDAHSLLALHTPKRKSTTDQFIFQRRTPTIKVSSSRPSAQAQYDTSANIVPEKEGKMKTVSAKQPKSKPAIEKSCKPAPAPKPKATKERPSKASTAKPPKPKPSKEKSTKTKGKIANVRKVKSPFQLVNEPDEEPALSKPEPELEHQGEGDEDDMKCAIQMKATQPLLVVEGKGKTIVTKEQDAHSLLALHTPKRKSTTDQFIFQRRTPTIKVSSSRPSAQAQYDTSANIVRDSPSPADAETGVASEKTNSRGDTEILQIDEEQGKDVDEQVNLEEKTDELDQSQAGSDPDELEKPNVKAEVVSMVTVPVYQASFIVLPLSTPVPVIDLSPPKPTSSTTQALIFTVTTTTLPPSPQQQSTTKSEVFTLELRDLPHKIDETVCKSMREVVDVALRAPLRDRFRKLPEAYMKKILHQRMFETGTYKSLFEHVALYEALEASMERANMDEFLTEMDKSHKRRRDDQDPPPPPPDSDLSKRRRHDTGASGSSRHQAPQSSAWKKSDT
nr:hypothetical protein [Tanacetum cinerariifolium]